jgi:hypothetical protein
MIARLGARHERNVKVLHGMMRSQAADIRVLEGRLGDLFNTTAN